MVIVPEGGGTGLFDVYSARDGHNEVYTVDLREERCTCPDHTHREVECKHIRRVKFALGIMHPPAGVAIDAVLARSRTEYGASNADAGAGVSAAETPASSHENTAAPVATDGATGTARVTEHHEDPALVLNATAYWRCSECGYESIHEQDLYRTGFHAKGCAAQGGR
jgi:hypothetical protein